MKLRIADWPEAEPHVLPLRLAVFVEEQGVPLELERDDDDPTSRHAWIEAPDGAVLATGRLLPDGHVGRMAVRADRRGQGLGSQVLRALIDAARARGQAAVVLNAQLEAMPFYARHGFVAEGAVFQDAGLPHRVMRLSLTPR
jgi:predicted GNAT family N-acyltransferase